MRELQALAHAAAPDGEVDRAVHPARSMGFETLMTGLERARTAGFVSRKACRETGLLLYCYTQRCVYDHGWDAFSLMARGLIVDPIRETVAATPFPKFFNLGEGGRIAVGDDERRIVGRHGLGDLEVIANHLVQTGERQWRLESPWASARCARASGNCKCERLAEQQAVHGRVLYIGDGSSDFCVSGKADFVLAKQFSGQVVAIIRYTLSGAGLLWILYFLPGGLWQFVQQRRDALLRRIAERRGIEVPSLVADRRVDEIQRDPDEDHSDDETAVIAGALS